MKIVWCALLLFALWGALFERSHGRAANGVAGSAGFTVDGAAPNPADSAQSGTKMVLNKNWAIQSSAKVQQPGGVISTAHFHVAGWYLTSIPSTVLAALVRNRVYPNPDFSMNLRSIPGTEYAIGANFSNIPMPPDSPFRPGWWYRTEFRIPASAEGRELWLRFGGINNSADIWLNGHALASAGQVNGMRRTYEFNITHFAAPGQTNTLALEVFAPTPKDLAITFVDWNPLPPDKDMGIFRDVYLATSGPVTVRHLQVITQLDLPSLSAAHLILAADVHNVTPHVVEGTLEARIGELAVSQKVRLAPHDTTRVTFTPESYPGLNISHPKLWWPYQYGPQNLYRLQMEFKSGGQVSDRASAQFGIREITSTLDAQNRRVFTVNGRRILIRGAGWSPDMLLRASPERDEEQIRYARDMHLNTIRLEGKLMDDHFFSLCDRYGVLVMAGWCCCSRWEQWRHWNQTNYTVAAASLRDQVRRLLDHPCILAFFYGSDNAPPAKPETNYLQVFKQERWPNPTVASASSEKTAGGGWTGVKMTGPYQYVGPSYWYLDHKHGGAFGFNTETSPGPAIPVMASLKEMLPADHLWPIDRVWDYHAGGGVFSTLRVYDQALDARYGQPTSLQDYVEKSQVMAYEGERAMFEAFGRNKYTSTGVIQWMLNNAWPSVIWHLYDYYLRPGGGYFGTKKACELVHVQYSYDDHSVVVVNSRYQTFNDYKVTAKVYNLDLKEKFSRQATLNIPPDSSSRAFVIPSLDGLSETYFVRLSLQDPGGHVASRNFYWLSTHPDVFNWKASKWYYTPLRSFADFTGLENLPTARVLVSSHAGSQGAEGIDRVTVRNPASRLAFFVHLRILKGQSGEDVHPILWQDNYFELVPGEKREVTATYRESDLAGARPVLAVDGWNVKPFTAQ